MKSSKIKNLTTPLLPGEEDSPLLPAFGGCPYIITNVYPDVNLYHIMLLPTFLDESHAEIVMEQYRYNKLQCCLVFNKNRSLYINSEDDKYVGFYCPGGGTIITDFLKPSRLMVTEEEYDIRKKALEEFIIENNKGSFLEINSIDEMKSKIQKYSNPIKICEIGDVPDYFYRCEYCDEWEGEIILSKLNGEKENINVSCGCINENLCAWCGEPLADGQLNSYSYNEDDGMLYLYSGIMGLNHICYESGYNED